jgi:hypothetical protein
MIILDEEYLCLISNNIYKIVGKDGDYFTARRLNKEDLPSILVDRDGFFVSQHKVDTNRLNLIGKLSNGFCVYERNGFSVYILNSDDRLVFQKDKISV